MHILLVHQSFATLDEPGGTRHYELARHLASLGHQVTVIASPVSYLTGKAHSGRVAWLERLEEPGISIYRTYTYSALHRSFIHRVFSFLSFMFSSFWVGLSIRHVDVVWGTTPPIFQGITAWSLARLKRVPFLFEVRDLWPAFAIQVGVLRNPLLIKASEWLERFLYSHADRLVVNSPGFIEHVRARGAKGVEVISNGADPRMFNPQDDGAAFRELHGLGGKYVVLYAGAHGLSNDLGIVLEAAQILRQHAEVVFIFLGDGKEKPALMSRAEEMGLSNVRFIASVPKLEMAQVLAAADACIAILKPISLYATVYPNKVFDYMAAGRPVLLAIDGVIREVVELAQAGISVQPGNAPALAEAILTLANQPAVGRAMGLNGRSYVETHFDRVVLADKLARLLQELLQ